MINLTHRTDLLLFVQDNISEYNSCPNNFTAKELKKEFARQHITTEEPCITSSEIGVYLTEKLQQLLSDPLQKNALDAQLVALTGTIASIDSGIETVANTAVLSATDLQIYFKSTIMKRIQDTYVTNKRFRNDLLSRLLAYNSFITGGTISSSTDQLKYIKNDLNHSVEKAMYLALANGFTNRQIDIITGTKVANEGDSAQFLFLARAVLAGYTCSNVDVRSSRYDAIIDYNGHLLKVQVKGISGTSISLKDRDRGGAGIDPAAPRNRGRYISSAEIDIYVAVDKQFGICYIIPAQDIDGWIRAGAKTKALSSLTAYKENWENIANVAHILYP